MSRRPRDRDTDPFDDMFRLMEQFMENMAANADWMLGPFGNVDFDVQRGTSRDRRRPTAETHLDVHEGTEQIRVVADLPGVTEDGIELRCNERTLTLQADGDGRRYAERVRLPAAVDAESASATYNNGVLEVTLERRDSDDGSKIEVA
ncbi:MAG: Hsp20/alpha crystallin family protein [Halorientalis sp.]